MNLLLAAALLLQEKTAEETFKKIEESIVKAKSVSFKFTCDGIAADPRLNVRWTGSLLLREGSKYRATRLLNSKNGRFERVDVSDGTTLYVKPETARAERNNTPARWTEQVGGLIARLGMNFVLMQASGPSGTGPDKEDLMADYSLSEFEYAPDDKGVHAIRYKCVSKSKGGGAPSYITLGYDPETMALKYRKMAPASTPSKPYLVETYDEFTLNADIPDEKFELPEEKK